VVGVGYAEGEFAGNALAVDKAGAGQFHGSGLLGSGGAPREITQAEAKNP
jgi:hypothetical protein